MSEKRERVEQVVRLVLDNWDAIGVIESGDGTLHMPFALKRRAKDGGISEERVWLRNITNLQRMKARVRAREWALSIGLDVERDRDLVDDLENYEILAYAIRDDSWVQHFQRGEDLFKAYDGPSLQAAWSEYDAWVRMQHPGYGSWDGKAMWEVVARVKAQGSIAPLAVMPGFEQASCVLFMARAAYDSPRAPWSQPSSEISTPAP